MPRKDLPNSPAPEDDLDAPVVKMAIESLRGDIRDAIIDWFKAQPKAWPFMNEAEKRALADAIDRKAYSIVRDASRLIAAAERPTIVGKLVEYKEKDGIEAKLKFASTGDVVVQLHEACGQEVLVVATGATDMNGDRGDVEIEPDQQELGIGDEYDSDNE